MLGVSHSSRKDKTMKTRLTSYLLAVVLAVFLFLVYVLVRWIVGEGYGLHLVIGSLTGVFLWLIGENIYDMRGY